jgi:hypothetical protein
MKNYLMHAVGLIFLLSQSACLTTNTFSASALPPPTVALNQMPTAVQGGSQVDVQFSDAASDGKTISSVEFQYAADGVNYVSVTTIQGDPTDYMWTTPRVDLSTAKVKVIAKDNRGFTTDQISNSFSILSTAPVIALVGSNQVTSKDNSVTFSGTCSVGKTIEYFGGLVPGLSAAVVAHYNAIHAPTCSAAGTWSLTIHETALSQVFSYTLKQVDIVGNATSIAFTWTRNTIAPIITTDSLTLNGCLKTASCTTSNHNLSLSIAATAQLIDVQYACFKWSLNGVPTAPTAFVAGGSNDTCWNTVNAWSSGSTLPSHAISLSSINYPIGFFLGNYSVYAWVQDSIGNVSVNAGKSGTDVASIYFSPAQPPVIGNIVVANTDQPATHITPAQMTAAAGAPIFIKWNIIDGNNDGGGNPVPVPASSISLYYTTDESNYTLIASGLSNVANGACTTTYNHSGTAGLPTETGCYQWSAGAPVSTYFKVRVVIKNSKDMTAYAASGALNTGNLHWLAGNTDAGLGSSASAAVLINRNNGHDNGDHHTLVVTNDGTVFFRDNGLGVLRIDPVSGVVENYLPKTGTYTGEGMATVRPSATDAHPNTWKNITLASADMINLDYQDNLLVWDGVRILKVDHVTNVVTTLIGGGTSTTDVNPAVSLAVTTPYTGLGHLFQPLPNGDIVFQGDVATTQSYGTNPNLRHYHATGLLAGQVDTLHFTGNGAAGNPTRDLLNDPCGLSRDPIDYIKNYAILFDPLTSTLNTVSGMLYVSNTAISLACPAGVNFDPVTGVNLGVGPHMAWTAPPTGTADVYTDASRFNARNGDLYSVSRIDSQLLKYNPTANTWAVVLGGAGRGHCAEDSPAVGCPMQLLDAYVTTSNQIFFNDNGTIRVVYHDDSTNVDRVKTLFGQSLAYGDGGLALSARFHDIPWLDVTAAGNVTILDDQENLIRQFPTDSSLVPEVKTIAGNGLVSQVSNGIVANTSPLTALENFGAESMTAIPGSEDILISQQGNGIYRLSATDGKWHLFMATKVTTGLTNWLSGNGKLASQVYGGNRRSDVLGINVDPATHSSVLLMAGYTSDAAGDNTSSAMKTIQSTDDFVTGTQIDLAQNTNIVAPSFDPNGTAVVSANIPMSQNLIRGSWDAIGQRWMTTVSGAATIEILQANSTMASFTPAHHVNAFTYVSSADSTASVPHGTIYYCSNSTSRLYKFDTISKVETTITWPSTTVQCYGRTLIWNTARNSLIFPIIQNNLLGVGEYVNP